MHKINPFFFDRKEKDQLFRIPKGPQDLLEIKMVTERYNSHNPIYVLVSFCYLYVL